MPMDVRNALRSPDPSMAEGRKPGVELLNPCSPGEGTWVQSIEPGMQNMGR